MQTQRSWCSYKNHQEFLMIEVESLTGYSPDHREIFPFPMKSSKRLLAVFMIIISSRLTAAPAPASALLTAGVNELARTQTHTSSQQPFVTCQLPTRQIPTHHHEQQHPELWQGGGGYATGGGYLYAAGVFQTTGGVERS